MADYYPARIDDNRRKEIKFNYLYRSALGMLGIVMATIGSGILTNNRLQKEADLMVSTNAVVRSYKEMGYLQKNMINRLENAAKIDIYSYANVDTRDLLIETLIGGIQTFEDQKKAIMQKNASAIEKYESIMEYIPVRRRNNFILGSSSILLGLGLMRYDHDKIKKFINKKRKKYRAALKINRFNQIMNSPAVLN